MSLQNHYSRSYLKEFPRILAIKILKYKKKERKFVESLLDAQRCCSIRLDGLVPSCFRSAIECDVNTSFRHKARLFDERIESSGLAPVLKLYFNRTLITCSCVVFRAGNIVLFFVLLS